MNKMIAAAALGFLTLGTLSAGLAAKADAFSQSTLPAGNSSMVSKKLSNLQKADYSTSCDVELVNGRYVSCCADSEGNWSCVW